MLQALLAACSGPAPALALLTLSSVVEGLVAHSGYALAAGALGGAAGGAEGVLESLAEMVQVSIACCLFLLGCSPHWAPFWGWF